MSDIPLVVLTILARPMLAVRDVVLAPARLAIGALVVAIAYAPSRSR